MTFEKMREQIMAVNNELDRLREESKQLAQQLQAKSARLSQLAEEKETLVKKIQEQCEHRRTIVIFHKLYGLVASSKMCLVCGLEEDCGVSGYNKLRGTLEPEKVINFSREEFYRHRPDFIL